MDVLVCRYHGKLLDFALRHLNDRDAAADIAQSTLVRVFQNARCFRATASFRTWLYTIALNQIRDEIRRRGRKIEAMSTSLEECGQVAEHIPDQSESGRSAEEQVLELMQSEAVWRAVGRLSDRQRSAVILRFRHDLTYDEIAEVMAVPGGTARSLVHHALKALRRFLGATVSES
jgi:RNA polymerase sigma-70 factor (ECF subfamily)